MLARTRASSSSVIIIHRVVVSLLPGCRRLVAAVSGRVASMKGRGVSMLLAIDRWDVWIATHASLTDVGRPTGTTRSDVDRSSGETAPSRAQDTVMWQHTLRNPHIGPHCPPRPATLPPHPRPHCAPRRNVAHSTALARAVQNPGRGRPAPPRVPRASQPGADQERRSR